MTYTMRAISQQRLLGSGLLILLTGGVMPAQQTLIPSELANKVASKFGEAKQYAFQGDLEIVRKNSTYESPEVLQTAKVKFAVASAGRCLLQIEPANKPAYLLASDGQTSWAYMPSLKKYAEQSGPAAFLTCDEPVDALEEQPSLQRDLAIDFTRRVVWVLAGLSKRLEFADLKGNLLSVISRKDDHNHQEMVYVTLDRTSLDLSKMAWLVAAPTPNGDKSLTRFNLTFTSLRLNESVKDVDVNFAPPKSVKRVKSLPIPGFAVRAADTGKGKRH